MRHAEKPQNIFRYLIVTKIGLTNTQPVRTQTDTPSIPKLTSNALLDTPRDDYLILGVSRVRAHPRAIHGYLTRLPDGCISRARKELNSVYPVVGIPQKSL